MADHRDDVSVVGSIPGSDGTVGFRELGECLTRGMGSVEAHELGDDVSLFELEKWCELYDAKFKVKISQIITKVEAIFHEKKVKIAGVGQGKQQIATIQELKEALERIMRLQMTRGSLLVNLNDFIQHLDETIDLLEKTKKVHKEVKRLRSLGGGDSRETRNALRNAIRCKGFIENFKERILGKSREEQARVQAQAVRALREAQQGLKDYRSVWAKEIATRSMANIEPELMPDLIQALAEYSVQNQHLMIPVDVTPRFLGKVLEQIYAIKPGILAIAMSETTPRQRVALVHSGDIATVVKDAAVVQASIAKARKG